MDKVAAIEAEIEQIDRDADTERSQPVPNLPKLENLKLKREAAVDRYDRALEKVRVASEVQDRQDRLRLDTERLRLESIRVTHEQVMVAAASGLRRGNAVAGTIADASTHTPLIFSLLF
jgi:hypothetical protein